MLIDEDWISVRVQEAKVRGARGRLVGLHGQFQAAPGNIVNPTPNFQPAVPAPVPDQPKAPIGVSQPGMMVQPPTPPPGTVQPGMIRPPGRGGNQ